MPFVYHTAVVEAPYIQEHFTVNFEAKLNVNELPTKQILYCLVSMLHSTRMVLLPRLKYLNHSFVDYYGI